MSYASYAHYRDFADVRLAMHGRDSKKVANNTRLQLRENGSAIALRLHNTDVLTFRQGEIEYNTGGWYSVTTKSRLNDFGSAYVWSDKGTWRIGPRGQWDKAEVFFDGVCTDYAGNVLNPMPLGEEQRMEEMRGKMSKSIETYVQRTLKALAAQQIPVLPEKGDCLFCQMQAAGVAGATEVGGVDHLRMHLHEGYVQGSVVWNAVQEKGFTSAWLRIICGVNERGFVEHGDRFERSGRNDLARVLRSYLRKRLLVPEVYGVEYVVPE